MPKDISPPPLKRRRLATTPPVPPPNTLRIFAWNINGIGPFLPETQKRITSFFPDPSSPEPRAQHSLRAFLRRHSHPHLLLLQEVKIAPSDTHTQSLVRASVSSPDPSEHYEAHFTLPSDAHNARGFGRKLYGVCTLIRADFAREQRATTRTVSWDAEGRFRIVETAGLRGWPRLSVWNVYAVNGTGNDYRDPVTGKVVGTRHDRKLAVHKAMRDEVARLEGQGFAVVLAGDMNVARGLRDGFPALRTRPEQHMVNRRDFEGRFFGDGEGGLGMCDTFREGSGERRYTYFPRGVEWGASCDRVDYVICSKGLKGNVIEAGMLDSEVERGPSDHVPVFGTFDFGKPVDGDDGVDADHEDKERIEPVRRE
ncbi:DNA-(apurinic or apyrimidinic site) lyase 2 [Sphaceloma murrayae]|uniref:DNA-(Apurinic or apyrimidinic site) lyase 2 n=1 Tax=Sphaceloma murrayae TaxID=2082308 RepID=A0A2K1QT85_9PEZI|nr:DNA-(apurinic or apyrimidinic site) lyase 2 [Sphaceloma murrayae]